MVEGNDGGATVTFNGGKSWSTILNQPTAQLYHVAADNQVPYRLYASQQDNTTISVPSRSDHGRITIEEWETVGGGEDGYVAPHPTDANIVYAADHHWLYRYDRRTKQVRDISPNPETHYGWGAADINFRFWWTYPVMVSPHDPKTLYVTSQMVHRTRNEGQSWEVVSPDLTRADPKTLEKTPSYLNPSPGEFWGPITREAYGPEWYATIFAFAESPKQAGVLWAGSDDGYVHVSRDNGTLLDEGVAARPARVRPHQHHRPLAPRRGHGLRGGHPLQAAGQRALSLQDGGLRQDVDEDRRRHPCRRLHAGHPRGSGSQGIALRRHRDGRLRLVRRRRPLAVDAAQPAGGARARPGGQGR